MDIVQTLYGIAKDICRPIAKCLCDAISLPEKFTDLNKRLQKLCERKDEINVEIVRVNLQKAPISECKGWIEDVDEIEKQVKTIEEQHLVDKRCLKGCFPDVIARVRLGGQVERMIKTVNDLQEKSKFEGGFVTDLPLANVEMIPLPTLSAEASTNITLQNILEHVRDGQTQKIGIWGMGGVGKTTLLKLLNNRPEIKNMFQVVIWVSVSKSWSIRKVQDEVAKRLLLDVEKDQSDERVARRLSRELEGKKYLLLLDDVWELMDLDAVGIPNAKQDNGCKVVLTSRECGVCRRMGTDKEIKVEFLPQVEAWQMFKSIVGDIDKFPTIKPIGEEIVRKCSGLPLSLKVVGGALRKVEDVDVWTNFLKKLKSPDSYYVSDVNEYVFKPLKLSYDQLSNSNTKECFLYCGLYPEDHEIKKSQLITYWKAEGLLLRECTLKEAGVEGRALLHDLVESSLLENCKDDGYLKMHDVIRDLVLKMTSTGGEESKHVVRAGLSTSKIPEEMEWEAAIRISLAYSYWDGTLPEMPNCPKLSTLLLQGYSFMSPLQAIPQHFFNQMPQLRVLDLSGTHIRSLPPSISNLVSLRALLLKKCYYLEELPCGIDALERLEVLCVTHHCMKNLPGEIWDLTSLKCLKLKSRLISGEKVMIPSGKISRLSQLEIFDIAGNNPTLDDESTAMVAKELCSLALLSSLAFDFVTVNNLLKFLENSEAWRNQTLRKFHFFVGVAVVNERYKYNSTMNYGARNGCSSIVSSVVVKDVMKRSESLTLSSVGQFLTKLSDLGVGNFSGLKGCGIFGCDALETFAEEDGLVFPKLERLWLYYLEEFVSFFSNGINVSLYCWPSLEELRLWDCPKLEAFPFGPHNLPKLKRLGLEDLPELVSFGNGRNDDDNNNASFTTLEIVRFSQCPKLEIFPFSVDSAPNLKKIITHERLRWQDNATKSRFTPLVKGQFVIGVW